jgi:uncharacterized membrane-anchored protein
MMRTEAGPKRKMNKNDEEVQAWTAHALVFGVAFLGVAFFSGVVAFFAAAVFLAAGAFFVALGATAGAVVLVMRPDLVLPRTRDASSSTAGAGADLRGLLALALGLAAAAVVVDFLGRPTAFLGAAAALVVVALAFCRMGQS